MRRMRSSGRSGEEEQEAGAKEEAKEEEKPKGKAEKGPKRNPPRGSAGGERRGPLTVYVPGRRLSPRYTTGND